MKKPIMDKVVTAVSAVLAIGAAGFLLLMMSGRLPAQSVADGIARYNFASPAGFLFALAIIALLLILAFLLIISLLPNREKRSSSFAVQQNENGTVRISLKALETLVNKCLDQHAELKVVTSSLFSDEQSVRVDIHIVLQTDISMPMAISVLQKQVKRYLEACSGVDVKEVRIFVDSTMPSSEATRESPYAIPESMLKLDDWLKAPETLSLQDAAPEQVAEEEEDDISAEETTETEEAEIEKSDSDEEESMESEFAMADDPEPDADENDADAETESDDEETDKEM